MHSGPIIMAPSRIQLRHEAQRQRIERYEASLRTARAPQTLDIDAIVRDVAKGFRPHALRDPDSWQARLKTRNRGRIALAAARYIFAAFPVPAHLEHIWLDRDGLAEVMVQRRKQWYIAAAQGGSLYKSCTKAFLSRKETHVFLNPPVPLGFQEALWHAVARSFTDDLGIALRIARSKIARSDLEGEPFWREAARFFCVHPAPLSEIDDFCDYFTARLQADRSYSLKGRTLTSLRGQMAAWHRELTHLRRMGEGRWTGCALPDWQLVPVEAGAPFRGMTLSIIQIKTARDLAAEGSAMHHCVYTYQQRCISGASSIWSLRRKDKCGMERMLTMEMNAQRQLVQIRGFANRPARPEEVAILRRWAAENGLGRV